MRYPPPAVGTEAFESIAQVWLENFQQDLKDFVHVVCDDPDLEDPLREAAASAVLYTLAPGDVVPDSQGAFGFIDDALALRIVLSEVAQKAPERFRSYGERVPELTASLDEDIKEAKDFFGDSFEPFRTRILTTDKIEFKGKRSRDVLSDPEWLEEEISVAALKLDFKTSDIASAIKRLPTLPGIFRQKLVLRK